MLDKGFQKGDVAALYLLNLHEYALIFHAVTLLGGVVHLCHLNLTVDDLHQQFRQTKPRFIFTVHKNDMFKSAKAAAEGVGGNTGEFIIYLDVTDLVEGVKFVHLFANDGRGFEHKVEDTGVVISRNSKSSESKTISIRPKEDVALICFDYENKPVAYTHYNLVSHVYQLDDLNMSFLCTVKMKRGFV